MISADNVIAGLAVIALMFVLFLVGLWLLAGAFDPQIEEPRPSVRPERPGPSSHVRRVARPFDWTRDDERLAGGD